MARDPESSAAEIKIVNADENTPIEQPEEGIFMDYANVVNLDWTLYDLRIRFGELMQVLDDDAPSWGNQHGVVLEKAAIRIPWHQAKVLAGLLTRVVESYERVNGELKPIQLPPAPPRV